VKKTVCVCGLGFVGLTLSVTLAKMGFDVVGVEKNADTARSLQNGQPHFHEQGLEVALRTYLARGLSIHTHIPRRAIDIFVIAVSTPLNEDLQPTLTYLIEAVQSILPHLKAGALVILRSTVPVGTTRSIVLPLLASTGIDVRVAFCPERTIEGKALEELARLPQIIGGLDTDSVRDASELFRKVTPVVIEVSSLETAEMIKLIDNSFRDYMFAFSNDLAMACSALGVDASEAIRAANTGYSRNNIPVPGPVGGICLTKDPRILGWSAGQAGYQLRISSRPIHEAYLNFIVDRCEDAVNQIGKQLADCKVCISGLAFKGNPPTDDLRNSPSLDVLQKLRARMLPSARMYGHDFVVTDQSIRSLGLIPAQLEELDGIDLLVIATNHAQYSRSDMIKVVQGLNRPAVICDMWRVWDMNLIASLDGIMYLSDSVEVAPTSAMARMSGVSA
jgi:UDP-N-acetyl-D-mannosaminuronic acid dehydrogenase